MTSGQRWAVGLDLGQRQDYSALAVVRTVPPTPATTPPAATPHCAVPHLYRWPLGTDYPAIVASASRQVVQLRADVPSTEPLALVVDATGVGRPVLEMLATAWRSWVGIELVGVTITGGERESEEWAAGGWREWRVPKRQLVSTMQVLLGGRLLSIASAMPLAVTLEEELRGFQTKITTAANDTYGAWREGAHDDLVLATALPCWALLYGSLGQPFVAAVGGERPKVEVR